jgi:hypothetical protein
VQAVSNTVGLHEKSELRIGLNVTFANPYRLVTDAKGFFASDEAWKYQEKRHRYIVDLTMRT